MRGVRALLWLLALAPGLRAAHAQEGAAATGAEYGASAVVRAPKRAGSTEFDAEAVHAHPGAIGEPARMLLDAPGVSRAGFAGGEISVWGATGSESMLYLDGVQLPKLFHAGGLRTTIHPALLRRVALIPGAPDASYGRGTGGVVEITSHKRLPRGVHGALRVDGVDASLAVWGAAQRVEVLVAARQGYLDRLAQQIFPAAGELLALPSHTDAAARIGVRLDAVSTLRATWTYAREQLRIARDAGAGEQERRAHDWFHVVSLALEQRHSDGARVHIVPFVTLSEAAAHERFSGIPLQRAQSNTVYGLRAEYLRADSCLELRIGLDARSERAQVERAGTLTLPAREGDIRLFGQVPVEAVAADRYGVWVTNVAPHASLVWRWRALALAPTLRVRGAWTAPVEPGPAWLWAVVRDERGGVSAAELRLEVIDE